MIMMRAKAKLLATLVLLLFFQHRGHSPASAHEGETQKQQLLPLQTQQRQGSNVTARSEQGGKGGHEGAGGYAGEDREPRSLRHSEKASSGGTGGPGGGSGGKGGRSSGGGETSLRQSPVRSGSSRRIYRGVLAPCALASGLVQSGMVMLLPSIILF